MQNGELNKLTPPAVAPNSPVENTKQSIRTKVWKHLEENDLVLFPRPVYNRIPNFKGAPEAAQKLLDLEAFKKANTVLINPDKPLESCRMLALVQNKKLVVPVPRLQLGLLTTVQAPDGATKNELRRAITRQGIMNGQPVDLDAALKVDLIVIGSVAVTRKGYRIGKGQGYTDLEFAIVQHMKALNENALIVTVVHDSQLLDDSEVPSELFGIHDVPVDIIVTPTQVIEVADRPPRPTHIMWNLVSQRRVDIMPMLKKIKETEEAAGKVIVLKEVDTDIESIERIRPPRRFYNNRRRSRKPLARNSESEANEGDGDASEKRRHKQRRSRKPKNSENQENETSDGANQTKQVNKKKRQRKPRPQIEFSVKVGNIAKTDRVRDIKSALAERGVKPIDITWRGVKGFCYLHFAVKPEGEQPHGVDSIIESLSGMSVGGGDGTEEGQEPHILSVEPAKPISRIETTDVTAV